MKSACRILGLWIVTSLLCGCLYTGMGACTDSCTDDNITTSVLVKIDTDRCMSDQFIHVTTYDRTVTIEGRVSNPTQKRLASQMAWSVPGVKAVRNRLVIHSLAQ